MARWGCCPEAPTEQLPPGVHGSTHTSVNGPVFVGGAGGFGPVSGGGTEAEVRAAPHPSSSSPAPLSHLRALVLWLYASTPRLGGPCPAPLQLSPANLPVAKGKGVGESWPGLGEGLGPSLPWPWPTPPWMLSREQLPLRWLPFLSSPHHPSSKELSHNVVFHQDW